VFQRFARLFACLLVIGVVLGQFVPVAHSSEPVIEGGRETEVLDLFAPYRPGAPVVEGWLLHRIEIQPRRIVVLGLDPEGKPVSVIFDHPSRGPDDHQTPSFIAVVEGGDPDKNQVFLQALVAAVRSHDDGKFWRISRTVSDTRPDYSFRTWGLSTVNRLRDWPTDGVFLFTLLALASGVLAWRKLKLPSPPTHNEGSALKSASTRGPEQASVGEPPSDAATPNLGSAEAAVGQERNRPSFLATASRAKVATILVLTCLVGAALRLWMVTPHALGVWPYSRFESFAALVYEGPGLALLSRWLEASWYQTDVAFATNLAFGILAPLVIFVHASYLLSHRRQALWAAIAIALLPSHIRFSASEVAFIPSIVLSSFTFVLVHMSLVEPNRWFRWGATLALPILVASMLRVRPLNILFLVLFIAVALVVRAREAPAWRRFSIAGLLTVVGLAVGLDHLGNGRYNEQVADGLSFEVVVNAWWLLFDPVRNVLFNLHITPVVCLGLAVWGLQYCWKQRPRLGALLGMWLLLFHTGHAYVIAKQPEMQARYYLHMAVPLVLLAAVGADRMLAAFRRRGQAGRVATVAVTVTVVATPWLYRGFILDYDFSDVQEYQFVSELRAQLPEGCLVYEFLGHDGSPNDGRFDRMGAVIDHGTRRQLLKTVGFGQDLSGELEGTPDHNWRRLPSADRGREQLLDPNYLERPEGTCRYLYTGLTCYGYKHPEQEIAPACEAVVVGEPVTLVSEHRFAHRRYDDNLSSGMQQDGTPVGLTLYRLGE